MGFDFPSRGVRYNGKCLAVGYLPGYEIARIRTGQYTPDDELIWQTEFAPGR